MPRTPPESSPILVVPAPQWSSSKEFLRCAHGHVYYKPWNQLDVADVEKLKQLEARTCSLVPYHETVRTHAAKLRYWAIANSDTVTKLPIRAGFYLCAADGLNPLH